MSSLSFGTSGLRGLVTDLQGEPARAWTSAFLQHLEAAGRPGTRTLLVGRDLRASSPSIAGECLQAALARGWAAVDCGALPTPALALEATALGAAAVMVTGSHIPDDRNGLKFYAPGEITKADEAAICNAFEHPRNPEAPRHAGAIADAGTGPTDRYRERYLAAFAEDSLLGLTVGIYEHSSVARDMLGTILKALGAQTVALGRADRFVPVDTEAHRAEDLEHLLGWTADGSLDAIVSTDGDADRPLVADAAGQVLRGDVLGLLTARFLSAGALVTPVTSSGAVESSHIAPRTVRTRVGSPYVIEAMEREVAHGAQGVVGFEANGGVLLGTSTATASGSLSALPTRDAVLPILCALAGARAAGQPLAALVASLGAGHALADRLKEVPASASGPFLKRLSEDGAFAAHLLSDLGEIAETDQLDGVRFRLADASIVHFRASGNAPELRVYVEGRDPARTRTLLDRGLAIAAEQTRVG